MKTQKEIDEINETIRDFNGLMSHKKNYKPYPELKGGDK